MIQNKDIKQSLQCFLHSFCLSHFLLLCHSPGKYKGNSFLSHKNEIIKRAPLPSHIYCDRQCWKCLTTTQLFAMNRSRIGRQLSTLPMWETPVFKIHIQRDPHYFQTILHIFNYQLQFSWMVMTPISVLWKGWALGFKPGLHCLIHTSLLMSVFELFGLHLKKQPPEWCTSLENLIKNFNQNTRNEENSCKYRIQEGGKII